MDTRDVLSFEKLNGVRNYRDWSFNMTMLLRSKGLYHFICEPEPSPPADVLARECFEEKKQKAFSLIYLALDETIKLTVRHQDSALNCWRCLKGAYEPVSRARQATVYNEFHDIRYQPGEDMNVYIARIMDKAKEVEDAGRKIEDVYVAFKMVWNLPKEYDSLVQQLYRLDDSQFTTVKVKEALLVEADRLRCQGDLETDASTSGAYAASKAKPKQAEGRGKPRPQVTCYRCGKVGHFARQCKNKRADSAKARPLGKKEATSMYACANIVDKKVCEWVLDSAATHHFCNTVTREWFTDFTEVTGADAEMGEGSTEIRGQGTVVLYCGVQGRHEKLILKDVYYTPNMKRNLISEWLALKHGFKTIGKFPKIEIFHPTGRLFLVARAVGRLFIIQATPAVKPKIDDQLEPQVRSGRPYGHSTETKPRQVSGIALWHARFGHRNAQTLLQMKKNSAVWGLEKMTGRLPDCRVCGVSKTTRRSFPAVPKITSKQPLELLHMDVCGPMPVASLGGSKYFLSIIDDYSRRAEVFFLSSKDQVFENFKHFLSSAERQADRKVKKIRTDNGMEFCSRKFESYLKNLGVKMERTNVYSPEMNGVAERFNRTAMEGVRSMLEESGLPQTFWAEAMNTYVYLQNHSLHSKVGDKTPVEMWSGRRPSVRHLRIFGSRVYVHIPRHRRSKLDRVAMEGVMVGYAGKTKGYRIWVPSKNHVIEDSHVKFDETRVGLTGEKMVNLDWEPGSDREDRMPVKERKEDSSEEEDSESSSSSDEETPPKTDPRDRDRRRQSDEEYLTPPEGGRPKTVRPQLLQTPHPRIPGLTRVAKVRKGGVLAGRYDVEYKFQGAKSRDRIRSAKEARAVCEARGLLFKPEEWNFSSKPEKQPQVSENGNRPEAHFTQALVPESFEEAMNGPDHDLWDKAMDDEIAVLQERKVWTLVEPNPGEKVLGSKWVYAVKSDSEGKIKKHKARLVALGYSQTEGKDYFETYSPVVNFILVRMFFALLVGLLGWIDHQYDVTSAYLYGTLKEHTLMRQPKGKEVPGSEHLVCKLKKSLYGLHQSGREWFEELDRQFLSLGFVSLPCTNCVYRLGWTVFVLVYVDDFAVFAKDENSLREAVGRIKTKFQLKDLGRIRQLLGVEFEEKNGKLVMHQKTYIERLKAKFSSLCGPGKSVPLNPNADLEARRPEEEIVEPEEFPYRSLIGSLLFLATRTRPDIMVAVIILSQFNCAPTRRHCMLARDLFRFVVTTQEKELTLSGLTSCILNMYTDASLATLERAKSMSGYMVFLGSVLISWASKKQTCTATSTMHAEYIALYDGVRELSWIRKVLENCTGLNCEFLLPNVYCDNDSARHYAKNRVENSRNRHIDIKYHFVREYWLEPGMNLYRISTKDNVADIMTKALPRDRFQYLSRQIFV